MSPRTVLLAASAAILLAAPAPAALACGGMISPDGGADLQGMSALLSHDGAREDLAVVVSYAARSSQFAWLMPLPAVPEVTAASLQGLEEGFRITTPPLESNYQVHLGLGFGGSAAPGGVQELNRTAIGNLEFVTLGATDAAEVATWMRSHGFAFHDSQAAVTQAYLARHWVLVAARSTAAPPPNGALAVRFTFATPDPVYPLAIAGAGHEGRLPMHLLVVTPYRPASATVPETVVRPAGDGTEPAPMSRLELRYSAPLSDEQRVQLGRTVAVPAGAWLTRYDAAWQLSDLRTDLVLRRAAVQSKVDFADLYARFNAEREQSSLLLGAVGTSAIVFAAFLLTLLVGGAAVIVAGAALGGFRKAP